MKRMIATLAVISALALACGDSDTTSGTDGETTVAPPPQPQIADTNAQLNARWNGVGLPVSDVSVLVSDETMALMVYETGDFSSLNSRWKDSFGKAGWKVEDTFTDTNFEAVIWTKDGKQVGWAIGADAPAVLVYLEDLNLIPAEESTVVQAKTKSSGERLTRTTRPTGRRGGTTGGNGPRSLRGGDGTPATGGGDRTPGGGRTLERK